MNAIEALYKLQLRRVQKFLALRAVASPPGRRWGSQLSVRHSQSIHKGALAYRYRGLSMLKNPFDVALYQELISELKPRTIIEIGSYLGTSALWLSDMLRVNEIEGQVISVDFKMPTPPFHRENITFLEGDALRLEQTFSPSFFDHIARPLLVIEDSVHNPQTTLAVLKFFDAYLRPGEYIIVEDGDVTDRGVAHHHDGGPGQGIAEFLRERGDGYAIDPSYCDRYGHNFTANPNGYLRRL